MSRGQLPRDPVFFPRMKYRAAKRRQWNQQVAAFMFLVSQDPDGFREALEESLKRMEPIIERLKDDGRSS